MFFLGYHHVLKKIQVDHLLTNCAKYYASMANSFGIDFEIFLYRCIFRNLQMCHLKSIAVKDHPHLASGLEEKNVKEFHLVPWQPEFIVDFKKSNI